MESPPKLTSELGGCEASRRLGFLALSTRELGDLGGISVANPPEKTSIALSNSPTTSCYLTISAKAGLSSGY